MHLPAGAVGGGAAPNSLVAAGAVAVLARGGVDAVRAIARADKRMAEHGQNVFGFTAMRSHDCSIRAVDVHRLYDAHTDACNEYRPFHPFHSTPSLCLSFQVIHVASRLRALLLPPHPSAETPLRA